MRSYYTNMSHTLSTILIKMVTLSWKCILVINHWTVNLQMCSVNPIHSFLNYVLGKCKFCIKIVAKGNFWVKNWISVKLQKCAICAMEVQLKYETWFIESTQQKISFNLNIFVFIKNRYKWYYKEDNYRKDRNLSCVIWTLTWTHF